MISQTKTVLLAMLYLVLGVSLSHVLIMCKLSSSLKEQAKGAKDEDLMNTKDKGKKDKNYKNSDIRL